MDKIIICKNCNKPYHTLKQCKYPITSYGIILFRFFQKEIQYLMIRRKNSFGYIDFIKGEYNENNLEYLQSLIDEMSHDEKNMIINTEIENFNLLWKKMWDDKIKTNLFNSSKQKFSNLKKNGILQILIDNSKTNWYETEWEFPKGRKNYAEKEIECASREFQEETGINISRINIIENIYPFEEIFVGTNNKTYKNKYFLAYTNLNHVENDLLNFRLSEVSKIEWKNLNDCIHSIRPYSSEKINLINNIQSIIDEYSII